MPTSPEPDFSELLRHYRATGGLTAEQIAKRASISAEALKALEEQARLPPHEDTLDRLADALDLEGQQRKAFIAAGRQVGKTPKRHTGSATSVSAANQPFSFPTAPAVLVFLIADLRGYTRFTQEQGDAAAAAFSQPASIRNFIKLATSMTNENVFWMAGVVGQQISRKQIE